MKMRGLLVMLGLLFLVSCGEEKGLNIVPRDVSSITPPGDGTEEISVPAGTFQLTLTTPLFSSHLLHKAGSDFEAPCAIEPSATGAARFIDCVVDVDELDLIMYGLSFNTKISSDKCQHVSYTPYYYLSAPAGTGPAAVSYAVNQTTGAITPDANGFSFNDEPYCPYDYSYLDGPNCCTGEYALTVETISGGGSTFDTTTESWGGEVANCLSGAGVLGPKSAAGWPSTVYTPNSASVGTGLSISKSYRSILENFKGRTLSPRNPSNNLTVTTDHPAAAGFSFLSLFYANYYNPAVWGVGVEPNAMAHPYYTFTCYDSAHEETGRIRLIVREWNVTNSISPSTLAAADQMGFDTNGNLNNDMGDWDDVSGIVNPSSPVPASPTPADFLDFRNGYPYFHIEP